MQSWVLILVVVAPLVVATPSSRHLEAATADKLAKALDDIKSLLMASVEQPEPPKPTTKPAPEPSPSDGMEALLEALQENTKAIQALGAKPCDAPFFAVGSECFYVNGHKRVSWVEAQQFCRGLGGNLAEPSSVNTLRAALLDKFPEDIHQFFWVGASEDGTEGNWKWVSGAPVSRSDWAREQPDGGNENCVVLSRDDFPALHDSPCYTHTTFICGKEQAPVE